MIISGFLVNWRMTPRKKSVRKSVSKVGKGPIPPEEPLQRLVPDMLSTRVKPSLPPLSNIFSATQMRRFSTPFARKSTNQSKTVNKHMHEEKTEDPDSDFCGKQVGGCEEKGRLSQDTVGGDKKCCTLCFLLIFSLGICLFTALIKSFQVMDCLTGATCTGIWRIMGTWY